MVLVLRFILFLVSQTRQLQSGRSNKVQCVNPMVIWSGFWMGQYRDDYHRETHTILPKTLPCQMLNKSNNSACLVCSEGHKPRTMRFTSVQTENGTRSSTPRKNQKEKLVSKMETSVSPLTRENLLEHENNHVMHQSSSQFVSLKIPWQQSNRKQSPEVYNQII